MNVRLTVHELGLLRDLAGGETFNAIAERRWIRYDTVSKAACGIYRKLGATSRAHAVAIGYELGLIERGMVDLSHLTERARR